MNTIAYFEIQSSDPARDIKFYETLFGWVFTKEPNLPVEYYRITTNSMTGGLLKRAADAPPREKGTNAFTCSIIVENFDKMSELILKNGGAVAIPRFAIPGKCWQGYFIDPDRNQFGIIEVDENAR